MLSRRTAKKPPSRSTAKSRSAVVSASKKITICSFSSMEVPLRTTLRNSIASGAMNNVIINRNAIPARTDFHEVFLRINMVLIRP
jgi:hypothetical protein